MRRGVISVRITLGLTHEHIVLTKSRYTTGEATARPRFGQKNDE